MIDLTKLRQDAMAATQGEWRQLHANGCDVRADCGHQGSTWICETRLPAEATHIANLSPSTAIALIEAVEAAKAYVEWSKDVEVSPSAPDLKAIRAALREALRPFTKE